MAGALSLDVKSRDTKLHRDTSPDSVLVDFFSQEDDLPDSPEKKLARKSSCSNFSESGDGEEARRPIRRVKSEGVLRETDLLVGYPPLNIGTREEGAKGTREYRLFFEHDIQGAVSPWHDVPLHEANGLFNFLCEIPKWSRAKFEVAVGEMNNPIKQDEKKGDLRSYKHGDMMFNYGFFPQTWEDPTVAPESTGCVGDNDPLDCIEIGVRQMKTGQVAAVKVLGVLAMIDEGETDWKVVTIRDDDMYAALLNDVDDVEREIPGCIDAIREWLRNYKVAEGKPQNKFGLGEQCMGRQYALGVIQETHEHWKVKYSSARKLK